MDNPLAHPPAGSMVSPSHRVFRDVPALTEAIGNSFIPRRGVYYFRERIMEDSYALDLPGTIAKNAMMTAYFDAACRFRVWQIMEAECRK
ncbi:MAG: hypothetical protein BWY93_01470 [Euryarchaeota archaeon ADurb.BinA087]|nr:MAG: hypothetical protein BWY93_01470 [Euryarchaeota archaeon ADurb.BinA087]